MDARKRHIGTAILVMIHIFSLAQSDSLWVQNNCLYSSSPSETTLVYENIEQLGVRYKNVYPFVFDSRVGLLDTDFNLVLEPTYDHCGSDLEFSDKPFNEHS